MPTTQLVPYLCYNDAPAAIDFLCKAFGFEEEFRYPMPNGKIGHAELACAGGRVMLASAWPENGFTSPSDLPAFHCMIHCTVKDVDAHFERARAAGATITAEPVDQHGHRAYRATDLEGHRWIFAGPIPKSPRGAKK